MFTFDTASVTAAGGKPKNEDTILVDHGAKRLTAIVADGLGAHGGGEIASRVAADALKGSLPATGATQPDALALCFDAANRAVLSHQTIGVAMKSTAVMLVVEGGQAVYAHVGDSRGYMIRGGRVRCQTMDHSASQLAVLRGAITSAEVRFHDGRSRLLRALGADEAPNEEITPLDAPRPGDAYLLCSDGFWEYVTEEEMVVDLCKSSTAGIWLSFMLSRIGARVPRDHDNLSAIAVICGGTL